MEIKEQRVGRDQDVESGHTAPWEGKRVLLCSRWPGTAPEANRQQVQVEVSTCKCFLDSGLRSRSKKQLQIGQNKITRFVLGLDPRSLRGQAEREESKYAWC